MPTSAAWCTSPLTLPLPGRVARARKNDVIFALLKALAQNGEGIDAEGVLEILPDGFGFLRGAEATLGAGAGNLGALRQHGLEALEIAHVGQLAEEGERSSGVLFDRFVTRRVRDIVAQTILKKLAPKTEEPK